MGASSCSRAPLAPPGKKAAAEAATALRIKLSTYRLGADGDLLDPENGWQAKMGASAEGTVLVRPDGFVAWRTSTEPTKPEPLLMQALATSLCQTPAPVRP